jgi:hypothetical protein
VKLALPPVLTRQYTGLRNIAAEYWSRYEGFGAVIGSPYLHAAVVFLVLTYGLWSIPGWWDIPLSVLPGIVSFTLAGFAMLIAFGNDGFKRYISDEGESKGPLLSIGAAFTHFLVIQTLALIFAIVAKARLFSTLSGMGVPLDSLFKDHQSVRMALVRIAWAIGFLLFLYSITSIVSITFSVFRVAKYFNKFAGLPPEPGARPTVTDANLRRNT